MSTSWFIIANPISGNRNFSKQWKEIQQLLNNKKIDFSFAFTKFSKHEIELVDTAIQQGFRNIIPLTTLCSVPSPPIEIIFLKPC